MKYADPWENLRAVARATEEHLVGLGFRPTKLTKALARLSGMPSATGCVNTIQVMMGPEDHPDAKLDDVADDLHCQLGDGYERGA